MEVDRRNVVTVGRLEHIQRVFDLANVPEHNVLIGPGDYHLAIAINRVKWLIFILRLHGEVTARSVPQLDCLIWAATY